MRTIRCGGREVTVDCRGCMCHELPMQFGNGAFCAECGCPMSAVGFDQLWSPAVQCLRYGGAPNPPTPTPCDCSNCKSARPIALFSKP